MKTKLSSLSQLSGVKILVSSPGQVDEDIFRVLSDKKTNPKQYSKTHCRLKAKVDYILSLMDNGEADSKEHRDLYDDFCRNLAAYLIVNRDREQELSLFLVLEKLLEEVAPEHKREMRAVRNALKQDDFTIVRFGFDWPMLMKDYSADKLAASLVDTEVEMLVPASEPDTEPEQELPVDVEEESAVAGISKPSPETGYVPEQETKVSFGVEDQRTEFKASFITGPGNITNQPFNICRAICSFLNSKGGTVYIGVDDNGVAIEKVNGGVAADLKELKRIRAFNTLFNIYNRDNYSIFIQKRIHDILRRYNEESFSMFSSCVTCYPSALHDNVIEIKVESSRYRIVYLDGVVYGRNGNQCIEMDDDAVYARKQDLRDIEDETRHVVELRRAIRERKQVVLYGYASNNSQTVADRNVEPIHFINNESAVFCYDLDKGAIRQFKISRIGGVRVTENLWRYEDRHVVTDVDLFNWIRQGRTYKICLAMSMRAKSWMCELHPRAEKSFERGEDGRWWIEMELYSLAPAVSFYLSMAREIEVIKSPDGDELIKEAWRYIRENLPAF